ncbi:MAG: glucose 1-dehydrogenase [Candidatus Dormibacteraeota bacterium]|nr:glucose 1-dehydrogenase [Candidatus Dormibacteraeota bacterium]MBV9526003.1 glucose 1-dehydrogenase [Candidatus Dormibacteraeota bacterium]
MALPDLSNIFDVSGKVAVITGATGGFGRMSAEALAAAGAKVMLTGRRSEALDPIVAGITEAGAEAAYSAGHPDSAHDVKRIIDEARERFGGIDILVTAAGTNRVHPIVEFPIDEWDEVMDVNVKGTWLFCREAGRVMIEQGRGGRAILLSSQRGVRGLANYTAYCPSKAAIDLLTKSLAIEWGPHRITVNAIAPNVFRTELTQWIYEDQAAYQRFLTRTPIGRLGEPEDFAGLLLYLSSRASDFMTGAILAIDGGYTST